MAHDKGTRMNLAIGILLIVACACFLIVNQMTLWGNTEHLKAEELLLAKVWSGGSAVLLAVGLWLAVSSLWR